VAGIAAMVAGGGALAGQLPDGGRFGDVSHRNIIENAMNSQDHTTLVAAVKAGAW